jgi:photosystem II stability/assembly factor-like uncharacterized protein
VTSSVGWIVGSRLLQTTDGGKNWKFVNEGDDGTVISETVVDDLHRFQFINRDVGITWDRDVLRRTSDGGRTWRESLSISADNEHQLLSFFFLNPKVGWVAGKSVYFTDDGGQNWQRLASTPIGDNRQQREMRISPELANYRPLLWFTTTKDGVMAKLDGMVHLTNDGGTTWQYVFDAGKSLRDVFFTNSSNGWLVGTAGFVARTDDGGRTWTRAKTPTSNDLLAVNFINSKSGCAVGVKCSIICTTDGGMTWHSALVKSLPETPPLLASVSFADEFNGWAVGGFGIESSWGPLPSSSNIALTTKDGGKTWEPVNLRH